MSLTLPFEAIDDLIYDARAGDLAALKEDLAALSTQHASPEAAILSAAVDTEPEAEGGSGSCLLHFPAANGNIGTQPILRCFDCVAIVLTKNRDPELFAGSVEDTTRALAKTDQPPQSLWKHSSPLGCFEHSFGLRQGACGSWC